MESIKELRSLCQSTRPAIYTDFLSGLYYRLSIYFTWLCLCLRMSANQVTVLSGAVAIIGGVLISSDSKGLVLLGACLFHVFAILDMSDGEVARYRQQSGVAGHYLDWYMHFVSSTSFVIGLFLASIMYLQSPWLALIGLLAVVIPILDKTVQNAGWTVICWTRLRDIKNSTDGLCKTSSDLDNSEGILSEQNQQHSWLYRRVRFLILAPLQDHWIPLILLLVAAGDLVLSLFSVDYIDWLVLDYRFFWLMYVGVLGPIMLFFNVKHMVQSSALKEGYRRLACPERELKFPQDDFLG